MERLSPPGSVELVLEGVWAPLKTIDRECGEKTITRDFPAISDPERLVTVTHDPDMKLQDCNVYTFTRLEPSDSFFVVIIDEENNVAMASIIRVDPQTDGDAGAFRNSIEFQSQMGITLPSEEDIGELSEIVTAFFEAQVAEIEADIESR